LSSDKEILKMISLLSIQNNSTTSPFKPGDLKKKISDKLTYPLNEISDEITNQMINMSNSFTSRILNQKVLKKLEKDGVLKNYQGNEHYKKLFPTSPGRKPSNETFEDRGGWRSTYKISDKIQQLKEILKKPTAIDYLHCKLLKNGYLQKILKYIMKAFLYLVKSSDSNSLQAFNLSFEIMDYKLSSKERDELPAFVNFLRNLDDKQIEEISELAAEGMMKEKEMFSKIVPLFGYVHL
jgi:hypothetical protein